MPVGAGNYAPNDWARFKGIGVRYEGAKSGGGIGIRGKAPTGIGLGILCWIATQAVAFTLAGAGHGWMGPLLLSVPLLVLYPFAFVRLLYGPVGGGRGDAVNAGARRRAGFGHHDGTPSCDPQAIARRRRVTIGAR